MESNFISGTILWNRVARSRAVRRIIEKSIARWAQVHAAWTGEGEPPRYRAFLQREGDGHMVHCQIEIISGSRVWIGSRIGQGIQQALRDCLAHMSAVSRSLALPDPQPLT